MFVCVWARDKGKELAVEKKNDGVESAPLEAYWLDFTTVTKISLRSHYVCILIMPDPWLSCWHEETKFYKFM